MIKDFPAFIVRWDDPNPEYAMAIFLSYEKAMAYCVKKHGTIAGLIEIPLNDTTTSLPNE